MPRIKVDPKKCNGCKACELACSLQHVENVFNPKRSRIRVFTLGDYVYPVIAGPYTEAECIAKTYDMIDGAAYDACVRCPAACPAKPVFKEPDVDIPLKCDFCGEPPDPQCVRVCVCGSLTIVED